MFISATSLSTILERIFTLRGSSSTIRTRNCSFSASLPYSSSFEVLCSALDLNSSINCINDLDCDSARTSAPRFITAPLSRWEEEAAVAALARGSDPCSRRLGPPLRLSLLRSSLFIHEYESTAGLYIDASTITTLNKYRCCFSPVLPCHDEDSSMLLAVTPVQVHAFTCLRMSVKEEVVGKHLTSTLLSTLSTRTSKKHERARTAPSTALCLSSFAFVFVTIITLKKEETKGEAEKALASPSFSSPSSSRTLSKCERSSEWRRGGPAFDTHAFSMPSLSSSPPSPARAERVRVERSSTTHACCRILEVEERLERCAFARFLLSTSCIASQCATNADSDTRVNRRKGERVGPDLWPPCR
mmetsp:Transcript_34572/g.89637  ORF Transcript_34572/g.89637 Transcript_34572/m.89637 type:complete len:359 (+) Transcript_34572:582-1658(+)